MCSHREIRYYKSRNKNYAHNKQCVTKSKLHRVALKDHISWNLNPSVVLLAECKSTDVNLDRRETLSEVFAQATRYNAMVKARYIIITNGLRHFCYEATKSGYVSLAAFPRLG